MRRLALKVAPHGAGRDGDGDAVRGEVSDELRDAGEQLHVWPARVLRCGATSEVVVDREWDLGKVGEQMGGCRAIGLGKEEWSSLLSDKDKLQVVRSPWRGKRTYVCP